MQETTVFTYRVSLSQTEWDKASDARRSAGDLWTRLVKIHRFCRRRHWRWPTESPLKAHFKQRFPLHRKPSKRSSRNSAQPLTGYGRNERRGTNERGTPIGFVDTLTPFLKAKRSRFKASICSCPAAEAGNPFGCISRRGCPPDGSCKPN
jgi:putative transposase